MPQQKSSVNRGRPSSAHRIRQKRMVRHAVASGSDMPPIGYVDRSSYFKNQGPTDEDVYWSGPVADRAAPWHKQPSSTDMQQEQYNETVQQTEPLVKPRQHLSARTQKRRTQRPASASSISVLSMLEFERKASNKSRRPKSSVGRSLRSHSHSSLQKRTNIASVATSNSLYNEKLAECFSHKNPERRKGGGGLGSTTTEQYQKEQNTITNVPIVIPTSLEISANTDTQPMQQISRPPPRSTLDTTSIASSMLSTEEQNDDQIITLSTEKKPTKKKNKYVKKKKKTKIQRAESNLEWATAFLGRVEKRLQLEGESELYKEFVDALRAGDGTLQSVQTVAKAILSKHPDLMGELDDYVLQSIVIKRKGHSMMRSKSAQRTKHSIKKEETNHEKKITTQSAAKINLQQRKRKKKTKHWNWILDVAKTPKTTAMKKETLVRLQKIPNKIDPLNWKRPVNSYPTGRYRGSVGGSGKFSTAFPMSNLERTILNASRCPGPSDYQDRISNSELELPGGQFSTSYPKSDVDWIIYRSKQIPGPLCYRPKLPRNGRGAIKISDANPKNYLEWAEYFSMQTPGPSEYRIDLCL